jgi:hypothetical protein
MPFPTDWEVHPGKGAGELRFGDTFEDVVRLLPDQPPAKLWNSNTVRAGWQGGGLVIHFNPTVTFIEFSRGAGLVARLLGADVFRTPAGEVVQALVDAGHAFDDSDPEVGYLFVFKDIQVGLWRQVVPRDEKDALGSYFDTVGAGRVGYYG